jgi:outer membrane lipopolysaccharide assembly protein LptE/RlpB
MTSTEILAACVQDWRGAVAMPGVARALLLPGRTFKDEFTRFVARELVLCQGDVGRVCRYALENTRLEKSRVLAFARWTDSINSGANAPFIMGVSNE